MKLWNKYKVTSIPSLVFVDAATGKVVCRNGLLVVRDDPKGEDWAGKGQKGPLLIAGCRVLAVKQSFLIPLRDSELKHQAAAGFTAA